MSKAKVAIIMGSASDLDVAMEAVNMLKSFDVPFETKIMSAHRTPDMASEYTKNARSNGISVIIALAGHAAHLAGAIAANTTLPVLGVPIPSSALQGLDALLATVQMPSGIPVATLALGSSGARNAAILAVEILAIEDKELAAKLQETRQQMKEKITKANQDLQDKLSS